MLKCEKHDSTNLCGRLYGTSDSSSTVEGNSIYTTSMNFADRTQTWSSWGNREPDIVSYFDTDDTTGGVTVFTSQMTSDFINMATSVAKYGGFYVSRYEAGENGASKKNQVVITSGSNDGTVYKGLNDWYGLYNTVKSSTAVDKRAVSTHMIYGSQYDQIINFLESNLSNEPQIGHADRQLTVQSLTGANESDVLNNIYDLEGNNVEWTAQAYGSQNRVYRGGISDGPSTYNNARTGHFYPASRRNTTDEPVSSWIFRATRLSLYF